MYIRKTFPVFELKVTKINGEVKTSRTIKKRRFLNKIDGLQKQDLIKTASFTIRYSPREKNESIDYSPKQFKEMASVARIFVSKSEIQETADYIASSFKKTRK